MHRAATRSARNLATPARAASLPVAASWGCLLRGDPVLQCRNIGQLLEPELQLFGALSDEHLQTAVQLSLLGNLARRAQLCVYSTAGTTVFSSTSISEGYTDTEHLNGCVVPQKHACW